MLSLISTIIGFLSGGLPKVLEFFQDKSDKKQELALAQLQMQRELELAKAGYQSQENIEAIKFDETQVNAQKDEMVALYANDSEIGKGASQWVVNLRASVRPVITYGLFSIILFVEVTSLIYAMNSGVKLNELMPVIMDDDMKAVWSTIIAFWFGHQAFSKK